MEQLTASSFVDRFGIESAAVDLELAVERALDARWPQRGHPHMTAFSHEGAQDAWADVALTIELDDHLELPFEMPDAGVMALLHGDAGGFAAYVAEACAQALDHADELRAAQDAMRARAEGFCRDLAVGGLLLPLSWISLAPHDHWLRPADVRFDIALEGLGEHLHAVAVLGEAGPGDDLAESFEHALDEQAARAALAAANLAARADGRADAAALALAAAQDDPRGTLLRALHEPRVDLPDGSRLYWTQGTLRSCGSLPGGGEWDADTLLLPGTWLAAPVAAGLAGGTADALVDHPALTALTVRSAASEIVHGRPTTHVVLNTPASFFDADGRTWPMEPTGG